jgi:drug/metabolite transporter (DMT)-like permease
LPERRIVTGHVALGAVQVGFGLFPVFGTLAFGPGGLSPLAVGAWRIAAGAIALCALAIWRYGRRAIPAARDLPVFFVCAMLGVAVNQALFLVGLSRSTPMNAGLVMSLIPIFTFGLAAAIRQERFSASRALGIAVALAGTVPLLFSAGIGELGTHGVGNLLMVTNALMYSGYLVVSKTLTRRYPVLVITAWAYVLSVVAVPFLAWGQRLTPETGATTAWWSLLYILAVPTVLAYLLNRFALAHGLVVPAVHPRRAHGAGVPTQHVRSRPGQGIDGRRVRVLAADPERPRQLGRVRRAAHSGHGGRGARAVPRYLVGQPSATPRAVATHGPADALIAVTPTRMLERRFRNPEHPIRRRGSFDPTGSSPSRYRDSDRPTRHGRC